MKRLSYEFLIKKKEENEEYIYCKNQKELCDKLCISQSVLSKYISGKAENLYSSKVDVYEYDIKIVLSLDQYREIRRGGCREISKGTLINNDHNKIVQEYDIPVAKDDFDNCNNDNNDDLIAELDTIINDNNDDNDEDDVIAELDTIINDNNDDNDEDDVIAELDTINNDNNNNDDDDDEDDVIAELDTIFDDNPDDN